MATPRTLLPMKPNGQVNYRAIRAANKARENIKAIGYKEDVRRKLSLFDAAICEWRNKILGESYNLLAEEYGCTPLTIRNAVKDMKALGGITLVGKGELKTLFPEGIDAALKKGGSEGGKQVLSPE